MPGRFFSAIVTKTNFTDGYDELHVLIKNVTILSFGNATMELRFSVNNINLESLDETLNGH